MAELAEYLLGQVSASGKGQTVIEVVLMDGVYRRMHLHVALTPAAAEERRAELARQRAAIGGSV
jgi:hypothetical protein